MHIGILTLPLNVNYGGILQAHALCSYLEACGHTTTLITRRKNHGSLQKNAIVWAKWKIVPLLTNLGIATRHKLTAVEGFKRANFTRRSRSVFTRNGLVRLCQEENFDLIIVGSDQTWNRSAAPDLDNFYLDFCADLPSVARASYACSFARDHWDYTPEETERCRTHLNSFLGISVRESNGCEFVEDHLGKTAGLHVDPTLLHERAHYERLAAPISETNYCFKYILDESSAKLEMIKKVCKAKRLKTLQVSDNFSGRLTVEAWLGLMANCDFVFTDSFHGVLFSIRFRKPFLVVRNNERGGARFDSTLRRLGLLNRMVDVSEPAFESTLNSTIDWERVEAKLRSWAELSKRYIDGLTVKNDYS